MATRTGAKPTRKRPVSDAGRRGVRRFAGNAKRGAKKQLRKHPFIGLLLQVLLGAVAVVALIAGVVLESSLYYLVMALGAFGALAIRRAQQMERARQGVPPKPTSRGPRTTAPPPPPSSGPTPAGGVVKCTATGRPADQCDCFSRHVATDDGVKRYGRPLGTPFGRAKAGTKS